MFRLDLGKCAAMRKRHKRSTPGTRPAMNRHRASDGMPGDRQGLHVQPGGGGRVEATLSVRTHGARRRRLRQGVSQALIPRQRASLALSLSATLRFVLIVNTPVGRTGICPDVRFRESCMTGAGR